MSTGSVGDGLVEKFFGKNGDQRLTVDKFKDFHMQLLEEVMKLEVRQHPVRGWGGADHYACVGPLNSNSVLLPRPEKRKKELHPKFMELTLYRHTLHMSSIELQINFLKQLTARTEREREQCLSLAEVLHKTAILRMCTTELKFLPIFFCHFPPSYVNATLCVNNLYMYVSGVFVG